MKGLSQIVILLPPREVQERVVSALEDIAAVGRNVATSCEAIIAAQSRGVEIVRQQAKVLEAATAPLVRQLANFQSLPAELFNVVKRDFTSALLEKQAFAALVNSFERVKDVATRIVYANQVVDFVECVKTSPQFARNVVQALSLDRGNSLSRKEFIQNHLMHFGEFRALLKLEGKAFTKAWQELMYVVKKVVSYLWRSFIKASIQPKPVSTTISIEAEATCKKEQLWPLLLAFKNP